MDNIVIEYKNKKYKMKKGRLLYVLKLLDEVSKDNKEPDTNISEEAILKKLEQYKLIDEIFLDSIGLTL